jgi:hypothetical protein
VQAGRAVAKDELVAQYACIQSALYEAVAPILIDLTPDTDPDRGAAFGIRGAEIAHPDRDTKRRLRVDQLVKE